MFAKESFALRSSDETDDAHGLVERERDTWPFPPELPEAPSLDAELMGCVFHLTRRRPKEPSNVNGVDAGREAVIHNAFFIQGKVPSLNDLLDAKSKNQPVLRSIIMRSKPVKGQRGARFSLYNEIKQDWKHRTVRALGTPYIRVASAYFGYLVVEETHKRDPSNVCSAAIKFIEDGLVEAGVIPNDGWNQVLGIRVHWIHRASHVPGVYVVMSDQPLSEAELERHYEEALMDTTNV